LGEIGLLVFAVTHPFARKTAKGWGNEVVVLQEDIE
jgi:hypothetical protein